MGIHIDIEAKLKVGITGINLNEVIQTLVVPDFLIPKLVNLNTSRRTIVEAPN